MFALITTKNERKCAKLLCMVSIFAGGLAGGYRGIFRMSSLTACVDSYTALITVMTVVFLLALTLLKLPVSASHTMYAAVFGILAKNASGNIKPLIPIFLSIIIVPVGSFLVSNALTVFLKKFRYCRLFICFLVVLGGYALGANNLAVAAFPFCGDSLCCAVISFFMALGTLFSDGVSETISDKVALIDEKSSVSAQISTFISTYTFALLGIPSSTSHAVIGSIAGSAEKTNINMIQLSKIVLSWVLSPVLITVVVYLIT